jgi:hypothetical protein
MMPREGNLERSVYMKDLGSIHICMTGLEEVAVHICACYTDESVNLHIPPLHQMGVDWYMFVSDYLFHMKQNNATNATILRQPVVHKEMNCTHEKMDQYISYHHPGG